MRLARQPQQHVRALAALRNQVPEPLRPAFDRAEGIAVATAAPSP
jgi:hypothetical protein